MKSVLCYGDSITWGYDPATAGRFGPTVRWPGILRGQLGPGVHVIEEGLNGRLTIWDNPFLPGRNGLDLLPPLLDTHAPLDLVILLLGTNDLQPGLGHAPNAVARGAGRLIDVVQKSLCGPTSTPPRVLLVAPPALGEVRGFMRIAFAGAEEKSRELAGWYREVAAALGADFLDASTLAAASTTDGIHPDAPGHADLARGIAAAAAKILNVPLLS